VKRRTLRPAKVDAIWACSPAAARQFCDDACEFVLQHGDAFADDLVGIKTTDRFDVVEEACRRGVVVEWFVRVGGPAVEVDAFFVFGPVLLSYLSSSRQPIQQDLPLLLSILLMPIVEVMQLVRRIVLEANCRARCPFCMLLGNSLLSNTPHMDRLSPP